MHARQMPLAPVSRTVAGGRPLADTRSDADGRFVVYGLDGNPIHALVVGRPGYQLATASVPTQGAGPVDIDLRR